ncbi:unnamed protein product [Sphenostylis stenocarpa]|uniref:Uncharacterized protein n=1 Tax=Sphenostylis stenocarpa TaxID=92480 RepID=A0AA86T7G5_9FABA|nr:unnamed protein product [Sphenostylis stenocarpa]
MVIYGSSLSVYFGSWVRTGGIQSESKACCSPKKLSGTGTGTGRTRIGCKFQSARFSRACSVALTTLLTTAAVIASVAAVDESDTLSNIPQTLSGECTLPKDCKKTRIQRPKSRNAESCTIKCVTTCIRGGEGSPGEGPFNVIRPLIVFKQGFRTRQYCLVECSDICNLLSDAAVTKAR